MVFAYFTPVSGSIGGGLIGLSAAILLLFAGEILGSSGLASSVVLEPRKHLTDPKVAWKLVFLSTFLLFSNIVLAKYFTDDERLGNDPGIPVVSSWGYLLGGLFVGFGTRLSNGCTTGHGICGMARLSLRSIAAVCTFMGSAFAMSAVVSPDNKAFANGTAFLRTDEVPEFFNRWLGFGCSFIIVIPTLYALFNVWKLGQSDVETLEKTEKADSGSQQRASDITYGTMPEEGAGSSNDGSASGDVEAPSEAFEKATKEPHVASKTLEAEDNTSSSITEGKIIPAMLASMLFATGLAVSQMVLPSKVLGFLALYTFASGTYDPTLLTVMIGGCIVSFVSYQFVSGWGLFNNRFAREVPVCSPKFCVPTNKVVDWKLLFGAMCFGIGWSIAGLCPGPATFLAASGTKPVLAFWWPFFYIGALLAQKLKDRTS